MGLVVGSAIIATFVGCLLKSGMFWNSMKFMFAPLEDVSGNALRELCYNHGADLTFTEMTRLSGLVRGNKSTLRKIELKNKVPTQLQLAAHKENDLKKFLENYEPSLGFSGINFNLGCPSPHLIKQGLGCALIKRTAKVTRMVEIVHSFGHVCSVKLRLGLHQFEKDKKVYLRCIKEVPADFFVVHARHGNEHYESPADTAAYAECVATGKEIIANGDITTREQVAELHEIGVKGVMIGRAAVRNPGIFNLLKKNVQTPFSQLEQEFKELSEKYNEPEKYRTNVLTRLGKTSHFRTHSG